MRQENENIIVSNFDGLDTTTTPDSMQLSSSPYLVNVLPEVGGGLRKRPGTRNLYRDSYGRYGVSMASVATGRGYKFLVTKEGTSLRAYLSTTGGLYSAIQKDNVFSSAALKVRAQIAVLNDIPTRALFFTGVNKPVQLQFSELVETVVGAASTSVVFKNAEIANGLSAGSVVLFKDRTLVSGTVTFSYNATTKELTASGLTAFTGAATFELVVVTWQWWAEARQWYGDRFYNVSPRLHLEATTDVNVAIPKELYSDLPLSNVVSPLYPITAYPTVTSFGAPYTYDTALDPTASTEYSFSDGSPYKVGAGEKVTPTPFYVTFGAIIAASQATSVHFFRRRELKFNGVRRAVTGANLKVLVNDVVVSQNTTSSGTAYGTYYVYKTENDAPTLNTTDEVKYVSFEAGATMGIPSLAVVQLVNVERTHIGSSATQTYWQLKGANFDGAYVPIHGIGDIADYYRGYYPSTGVLYKGRLAIGGFRHQPQSVYVSAEFDSRTAVPYSYFMVVDDDVQVSDPIDARLPTTLDDKVVALTSWQDSHFILGTSGVYRLTSGDSPSLLRGSIQVSLMTKVGCVNPLAVASTETGVYFLSTSGLFSLRARDNLRDQYDAEAASLKINNVWNVLKYNPDNAWIAYDASEKLMYVGLPEYNLPQDYALKLYVFHVQLSTWTEYYTHAHFRTYHAAYHDGSLVFAASTQNNLAQQPANFVLSRFNDRDYNLDFTDVTTITDVMLPIYASNPYPMVTHTTVAGIQEYATEGYKTGQLGGFRISPLMSLRDVRAFLNGVELLWGSDISSPGAQFIKLTNGNIYLLSSPTPGQTLKLIPRSYL